MCIKAKSGLAECLKVLTILRCCCISCIDLGKPEVVIGCFATESPSGGGEMLLAASNDLQHQPPLRCKLIAILAQGCRYLLLRRAHLN